MGVVYDCFDPQLERRVAIKVLKPDEDPEQDPGYHQARIRLHREAQSLARLSHPNVIPIFDIGEIAGCLFIAMERLQGKTLSQWWSEPLGPQRMQCVLDTMCAAGQGLVAAHRAGIVHRDFKPENVFVCDDGRVLVLDFGLARQELNAGPLGDSSSRATASIDLTVAGSILGTPLYMAPEQHQGQVADERSDQFAFAVSLFEGLYGVRPYKGRTLDEVSSAICRGRRTEISVPRRVARRLHEAVLRGMATRPEERYPSMAAMLEALSVSATRHRWAGWIGGGVLLAGALHWAALPAAIEHCSAGRSTFDQDWSQSRRQQLQTVLTELASPSAEETRKLTMRALDGFRGRWLAEYQTICTRGATHEQRSGDLDLQMQCLDDRRLEFMSLTREMLSLDGSTRALDVIRALPDLERCTDARTLRALTPEPRDPVLRERVRAQRSALSQAQGAATAGNYVLGLELARALSTTTADLDFLPLEAEVEYFVGLALSKLGRSHDAIARHRRAIEVGTAAGHDMLVARATMLLMLSMGYGGGQFESATTFLPLAESRITRADEAPRIAAQLANIRGILAGIRGRHAESEYWFREQLEILRRLHGEDHPSLSVALDNLGAALYYQDRIDASIRANRQSVRIGLQTRGRFHPRLVASYGNMGSSLARLGRSEEAVRAFTNALEICVASLGPDSPNCAHARHGLASHSLEIGRDRDALREFRALAGYQEQWGMRGGPDLPWASQTLATMALHAGRLENARRLAEQTLASLAREPRVPPETQIAAWETMAWIDLESGRLDEVERWLEQINTKAGARVHELASMPRAALRLAAAHALKVGRPERALDLRRELLQRVRRRMGAEHPRTVKAMLELAQVYAASGRTRSARDLLEAALEIEGAREQRDTQRYARIVAQLDDLTPQVGAPL